VRARRRGPVDGPDGKGYYFEPTIFTGVDNKMTIAQEEIFGPVLSVIKVGSDGRGHRGGQTTRSTGLASAVWTEDYDPRAWRRRSACAPGPSGSTTTT